MSRPKSNRQKVQKNNKKKQDRREDKVAEGTRQIMDEQRAQNEDYNLSWFKPTTKQKDIVYHMAQDDLVLVSASSGCGKTTCVIWNGLRELKAGRFKRILFVKTPVETGDDMVGFLKGDIEDKLTAHFEVTKGIFTQFMSLPKLEMEIKRGRIILGIPNYIQGATFDDTLIIIDESQNISPPTLKLLMERVGDRSKIVVMGDKRQKYANKKRVDGFTDFVKMVTDVDEEGRYSKIPTIGYVEMTAEDNMRSELSKLIVSLYEEKDDVS